MEHIPVALLRPGQRPAAKPRAPSAPRKPLTTNPPHPLIKAADDELVLRGMAYRTRKSYGQHMRNYFDGLKVMPEGATREDIRRDLVQMATSGLVLPLICLRMVWICAISVTTQPMSLRAVFAKQSLCQSANVTVRAGDCFASRLRVAIANGALRSDG